MCCSSSIGPCKFSKWPCNLFREWQKLLVLSAVGCFLWVGGGLPRASVTLAQISDVTQQCTSVSAASFSKNKWTKLLHAYENRCQLYPTLNCFYCLQHMKHVAGRFTGTFRNWRVTALSDWLSIESKRELKHTKHVWWWFLSLWSQLCSVFG